MVCCRREGQTVYYHIEGPPGPGKTSWADLPYDSRDAEA
jgi:hypothetical protein